jgi:DNA-binding IscR family transcriptional regulator
LITATRGRGGGVKLARAGSDILLNEVVLLFMKMNDYKRCFLGLGKCDGQCGLHLRWRILSEKLEQMLTDTTIDQVLCKTVG